MTLSARLGRLGPMACGATVLALCLSGCLGNSAQDYLHAGRAKLEAGDLPGAAIELRNALQKDASLGEARYLLGAALLRQGDTSSALDEFNRAERVGYDPERLVPLTARALVQLGRFDVVLTRFDGQSLQGREAMASLQSSLAQAYLATQQADAAEAALQRAQDAVPGYLEAAQLRTRLVAWRGNLPGAVTQAQELAAQHPGSAFGWTTLGDLQLAANQRDAALVSYRQATKADPSDPRGYLSLLPVQMANGDLADAETTLAALEKLPAHPVKATYFKAWLKLERGQLDEAQGLGDALLKHAPNNADLLFLAGAIEARRGATGRAADTLAKAVAADPAMPRPRLLLARVQMQRGEHDKALRTLQPLLSQETASAEALVLAATASARVGDAAKVEALLARAAAIDPRSVQAQVGLSLVRMGKGGLDAGLQQLRDVAASTSDATADVALIELLIGQRRFEPALSALKRLEDKPGGKPLATLLRGRLELARNNAAEAREAFSAALQMDASNIQAAASLAGLDLADHHVGAAQERFQKVLDKDPGNAAARAALLRLKIDEGASGDDLLAMARDAVKHAPGARLPRVDLIRMLLAKPDPQQAIQVAQESLAAMGDDAEVLALLGQAQLQGGQGHLAMQTFIRLQAVRPNSPQVVLWLSQACLASGDTARALQTLQRGVEAQPDEAALYRAQAQLHMKLDESAQALRVVRQFRTRDRSGWQGAVLEAEVLVQQKRFDDGLHAYQDAYARHPASAVAVRLHQTLLLAGKVEAAAAFGRQRLAADPKDVVFMSHLAEDELRAGRLAAAAPLFRQALAVQPQNPALLNNLAWVQSKQGRVEEALDLASRAVKLAPSQPDLWDTLAEVRGTALQYDAAIQAQQQALKLAPEVPLHRLHLAGYLLKAGRKAEAKTELTRLTQLGAKFDQQADVQRLLATL